VGSANVSRQVSTDRVFVTRDAGGGLLHKFSTRIQHAKNLTVSRSLRTLVGKQAIQV
jgi:hypothetical protein